MVVLSIGSVILTSGFKGSVIFSCGGIVTFTSGIVTFTFGSVIFESRTV